MKSFRFQFIDLNESYTISTARTEISGYIGIRAPKGLKEAQLFTQGNEKHIRAMIGIPTAHWPDIAEAIAFNNGYDLYIQHHLEMELAIHHILVVNISQKMVFLIIGM